MLSFSGLDGSRKVTAQIDPTGVGEAFTDLDVTTNGDLVCGLCDRLA